MAEHLALRGSQITEPNTLEEALTSDNASEWREALDSEYKSLMENHTWDLVDLPPGREAIPCKWVFKVKYKENGDVDRFKARLVAKGYVQKHGIDYEETFSPVVRFSSIRVLLSFALQNDMIIHQMDVVTAFLHGELKEEIYMVQPNGFTKKGKDKLVCKLQKSLYGLKQAPRCWNKAFQEYMITLGFSQSTADPCVYIQVNDQCILTIVAVYVDDLILMCNSQDRMQELKQNLASRFKMKDMGPLHFLLGVTVVQGKDCIAIHQKQYILKLLKRFGMEDAYPVSTPADVNTKLVKSDGVSKEVDSSEYQSLVGSLLYAAIATRPDIAHAVGAVSKFCSNPSKVHLNAAKRILRYLKGTLESTLMYSKSECASPTGYADANWAGDLDTRRSTSGNLFRMSGGAVSWASKTQSSVALSSSEAEYMALSMATQEATWIQKLLSDLKIDPQPIRIMEDNQGAIAIARNPVSHSRTKHIDIRYHYVREALERGIIDIEYCPTEFMAADLLTKPLPKSRFETLRCMLGMNNLSN